MKSILGSAMIAVVGVWVLSGCSPEVSEEVAEEGVSSRSDALLVSATALSRGTRRDYDGDGKEDVIFFDEDLGTYQVLGNSPGGFNLTGATLIRSDLKPSNTKYTAGDFNHDGKTDLLVTTASGTSEWTGKAGGGFNTNVWSSTTFKLSSGATPNFDITVGDFNGDGFTDFIATTANGSYLYTGKGTGGASGGFNANVWTNTTTAFKRGNVAFTPGNFDTNGTTDFIATTSTGSSLYVGTAGTGSSGGFAASTWSDTSMTSDGANVSRFAVGNVNGVGGDDFIVQKTTGAFLYTAKTPQPATGPTFVAHGWQAPSLDVTASPLLIGDYNGDGCSDFLYQDGSALRVRTYKQGTASVPGTFNDAVLIDTRFPNFYDASLKRGDFTGDGRDDFIVQTRVTTGDGSHEFTGTSSAGAPTTPPPESGGFNPDVWTSTSFFQYSAF
jgi:hypothetical protein